MIIIALLISLFLAVDVHALDKKLVSTNCFKMVITDTSGNGIAGLDAATPFDDFEVKAKCGSDSIITLNEAGDTIVDEGGGVYYYCTDDTLTTTNENECVVWTVGEGNYSLATNPVTSLLAKNPLKFKAVGATIDAVTLADDAITAAKISAAAIGSSETGEYAFTVVSSGDCTNSAVLFDTNLTQTQTDHWRDSFATFTTGVLAGQTKAITAFNGTTKCMTVKSPGFSAIPQAGDAGILVNK